ncbi:MAG TPA: tannase/feruloyl esterase family alpha/beta hydrolase, partial [Polyangiaceae bacterium]
MRPRLPLRIVHSLVALACASPLSCAESPPAPSPIPHSHSRSVFAHSSSPLPCPALTSLSLPHVTLTDARLVPAGSPRPGAPSLPAHCRVDGVSRPVADSEIRFEVLMPVGDAWNGRYQQVGNGAFGGRVPEGDLFDALAAGYATAGTDDGHQAPPADASWALGHPEKVA